MAKVTSFETNLVSSAANGISGSLPTFSSGSLLIWFVSKDTVAGGSLSTPQFWTKLGEDIDASTVVKSAIFYKSNVSASEAVPITTSTDSDEWVGVMVAVEGYDKSNPIEAVSTGSTGGSIEEGTVPSVTTLTDNAMVMFYQGMDGVGGPSLEAGMHKVVAEDGSMCSHALYWDIKRLAGATGTREAISSVAHWWTGAAISIPNDGLSGSLPPICRGGCSGSEINHLAVSVVEEVSNPIITGNTINDIPIENPVSPSQIVDFGINSYQRATEWDTTNTIGLALRGRTVAFSSLIDFSDSNDNLFLFHFGALARRRFPLVGRVSDIGYVVVLHDSSGNWRAYHTHARDAVRFEDVMQRGFALDPNDTITPLTTSGNFDVSAVSASTFLLQATLGLSEGAVSRLYEMYPWVLTYGTTSDPASLETVRQYQDGAFARIINLQGSSQYEVPAIIKVGDNEHFTYYKESDIVVEFPIRSTGSDLAYHGTPGKLGYIFDLTDNCNVILTNCIYKSAFPWRWVFNNKSGSTVSFTDCTFGGADPMVLQSPSKYRNCIFTDCGLIEHNGADVSNCTFTQATGSSLLLGTGAFSSSIFRDNNVGIRITGSGTYTFDNVTFTSNTTADVENYSGGAVTINIINGGSIPSVVNSGSSTTTVNNFVDITLTGVVSQSRVLVEEQSDESVVILETANGNDVTGSFNYSSDTAINVIVRKSSGPTKYIPFKAQGTITSAGFTLNVSQVEDTIAS